MQEATGIAIIDINTTKAAGQAPKRFMIAMAPPGEPENGMHFFMTRAELELFCIRGIELTCDGHA